MLTFDDDKTHGIIDAYRFCVELDLASPHVRPEILQATDRYPAITAKDEFAMWKECVHHRARLKKVDIIIPTVQNFKDRLWVEPTNLHEFQVTNLTKGNTYKQTYDSRAGRWVCNCPAVTPNCKHLDAVDEFRGNSDIAPKEDDFDKESEAPTDIAEVGEFTASYQAPPDSMNSFWDKYSHFPLNQDQYQCLHKLHDWFQTSDPLFRLLGPAGTGKSTVITVFVKWLIDSYQVSSHRILMASAFNKAVKVIREKLVENDLDYIATSTLTRALGLREQKHDDKVRFVRIPGTISSIEDYQIVIVDEASTVAKELWEYLREDQNQGSLFGSVRIIVMGDPYQLPPINEAESESLTMQMPEHHLQEVMRHGGPILKYVTSIRENITQMPTTPSQDISPDKNGVFVCKTDTWFQTMSKGFKSDNYKENPNHCRAIAWTNQRVKYLNQKIRMFLGYGLEDWVIGERIIAMAPFFTPGKGDCLLTTSQEATILEISEGEYGDYAVYFFVCRNDEDVMISIPVVHKRDRKRFQADVMALAKEKKWAKYWALQEGYAQIEYSYAMTAHKAQGSTFVNTWVDLPNFQNNRSQNTARIGKVRQAAQLAYVGASRAQSRLFVLSN